MAIQVVSTPVIYLPSHRFQFSFGGQSFGQFSEAEGFDDFEFDVLELDTGDSNVVASQSAGKVHYDPLKLSQGATKNVLLRQWALKVVDNTGVNGDVDPNYKLNTRLSQLDRDGSVVGSWTLFESFPQKYSGGKFDGKSKEFRMISCTIKYRYNQWAAA